MRVKKDYNAIFQGLRKKIVYSKDRKEKVYVKTLKSWKQCYSAESKARKELPQYWFVDDKGDVISVARKKPILLKRDYKTDFENRYKNANRYNYHYDGHKNITASTLVALCFGSEIYGKAKDLLKKKGLEAFGNNADQDNVQVHHHDKQGDNNNPDNLELLTSRVHKVIHNRQKGLTEKEYLLQVGKVAAVEEPERITALLIDDKKLSKKILSVDEMRLCERAQEQLQRVYQECYTLLANKCLELVLQIKDIDYFDKERFVCYENSIMFRYVRTAKDTITSDLVNYDPKIKNIIFIKKKSV